jgi:hypothetical protein
VKAIGYGLSSVVEAEEFGFGCELVGDGVTFPVIDALERDKYSE